MTIPATHAEIEQLYLSAELQHCRSICLTSSHSDEGVTSIAIALTERYLLAGYRTILVDLNLFHPGFSTSELLGQDGGETWIEHTQSLRCFNGLTLPQEQSAQLMYKRPDFLQQAINEWQKQYDRVVIDTSPLLNLNRNNIPAPCVAHNCDGTILVVLAGKTTSGGLQTVMQLLAQSDVSLIGTVLNCRDKATMGDEICREINRIPFLPSSWKNKVRMWVNKNEYLSAIA